MVLLKNIIASFGKKLIDIKSLSIKKLTLLGFTLATLPLVLALLSSANQVNQLSKQGENSIFTVAELINTNQQISSTLKKMERYASQYLVLHDDELMDNYIVEQQKLLETNDKLNQHNNEMLKLLTKQFAKEIFQVHQSIVIPKPVVANVNEQVEVTSLEALQKKFKDLIAINEEINSFSRSFINQQAQEIKNATTQVSRTLLISLFIIPISILIAGIFILLITNPLKLLILKIQQLQQGNFEQPLDSMDEGVAGFIEIKEINDALNSMKNRLHALELQKSSFIRHISHELKTPLAAIREGTELIYDNSVGSLNSDQQEITKIIRNSTTRLQRLIEELLEFNIVLDSTSLQDRELIYFPDLIDDVLTDCKLDIKRRNLAINKNYSNFSIESNTKQLKVIIDNLLSNAIKYSPEYGAINISATLVDCQLAFSVSDHGEGIEKNQQGEIFDAFYQGKPPKDYNIKSSGLGLTIVKELLMRLNGTITFQSQTQAPSGTTMSVLLNNVVSGGNK